MTTTDTDVLTIGRIAEDFSGTIFWNYTDPWPTDAQCEFEYPLVIRRGDGTSDEQYDVRYLTFESGEASVGVAEMRVAKPDADAEFWCTDADARFIANLPVYIPVLLETIRRQTAALKAARALIVKAQRLARDCGYKLHDTYGALGLIAEGLEYANAEKMVQPWTTLQEFAEAVRRDRPQSLGGIPVPAARPEHAAPSPHAARLSATERADWDAERREQERWAVAQGEGHLAKSDR